MDYSLLDEIIIGRVEPHIYAFSTNTIPNYLKVGDTYRPVSVRLKEWEAYFPTLKKEFDSIAKIDDVYFRDFAVHKFLETEKSRIRLLLSDIPADVYYSKEFFKDVSVKDLEEAIEDIKRDFSAKTQKYSFYNAKTLKSEDTVFQRTENYLPRPNQKDTVEAFKTAVANGRHNLLMYAVMRFGKSFTSMCCAVANNANLVVVVSAKADVLLEWKKTVESHVLFADYVFIYEKNLLGNNHLITEKLSSGKKVVVFLTLQDLQGKTIKDKHQEVFGQDIDLLLVDETHFGARAEKYGEVLKGATNYVADAKNKKDADDFVEASEADATIKVLKAKNTIHLSGTPYRILMGSEFSKEDIIAFYQFTDIVNDQKKWDEKNFALPEEEKKEDWENPYYGFPQMVRFAFVPNESSRKKLESLKKSGTTYAFSALFKPKSIIKEDDGSHKLFENEEEILDLFSVIDGSKEDDCLLGFLDYDKIKEGKMCRHMVIVLPYCASCDALEALIKNNKEQFKNLGEYEIVNISGVDNPNKYKTAKDVKRAIEKFESEGKKTITLTVNRMLTGSTVCEWDTMLFFKDTASPQEYDQAVFRLQNQYVKTYNDENGNTIKYNMKPQTLLVDFDPQRMFVMQEQKSQAYVLNVGESGNAKARERLEEELEISPIITLNKDKMVQVVSTDIMQAVSHYSANKGVADEVREIPVDLGLLSIEEIRRVIERENELGDKAGLTINAYEGKETDMDTGDNGETSGNSTDNGEDSTGNDSGNNAQSGNDKENKDKKDPVKQFRTYYSRILFFAFLTKNTVGSLGEIVACIDEPENTRIARNLGISKNVLIAMQRMYWGALQKLDYKIQNINKLSNDDTLSPAEKASVAINKFGKLGDAIVVTPSNICDDMVNLIPKETYMALSQTNGKVLDIAGTAGEYAVALYKKMRALGVSEDVVKNSIYAIPKSSICYELTRKLYEMLGLNVANIAKEFVATDLLKVKNGNNVDYDKIKALLTQNKPFDTIKLTDTLTEGEDDMIKFEAVVGNPPYQEENDNTRKPPVYHLFYNLAFSISNITTLITPARFLFNAGQTPQEWNKKMLNNAHFKVVKYFNDSKDIFNSVDIKGGVAITLCNNEQCFGKIITFTAYPALNTIVTKVKDNSRFSSLKQIISSQGIYRFSDEFIKNHPELENIAGKGTGAKIVSREVELLPSVFLDNKQDDDSYCALLAKGKTGRVLKYIKIEDLQDNLYLKTYNVSLPESNGVGAFDVFSSPIITIPNVGVTDTFISLGAFNNTNEATNLLKYVKTKFLRALLGVKKVTQHNPKDTWEFVPLQDFTDKSDIDWSKSVAEIDQQLYKKYNLDDSEIAFIEKMIKPM